MLNEAQVLGRHGLRRSMEVKQLHLGRSGSVDLWSRRAPMALILDLMTLSLGSPVSVRLAEGDRVDRAAECHFRETGDE